MSKTQGSVYIATSLDGFIARENGEVGWLQEGEQVEGEDFGYHAFMESVDVLVMGRNSFEMVLSFDVPWPYGEKKVVVLTSKGVEIPAELQDRVEALGGTPEEIMAQLSQRGFQHAYIDGGITVQRFLAAGLIQKLIITRVPRLLGSGIPLFGPLPADLLLKHVRTEAYANGMVQSEYNIAERSTKLCRSFDLRP